MRIDSNGRVGIGTSSFSYSSAGRGLLEVNGSTSALIGLKVNNVAGGYLFDNGTSVSIGAPAGRNITFDINGEKMRIDSSGNVGIGVVPQTGGSTWQHVQFGGTGNLVSRISDTTVDAMFASNYYVNASGTDSYIKTGAAARMFLNDSTISFDQAASGTAGTAISWSEAMRIDSSGNLLVGKTSLTLNTEGHALAPTYARFTRNGGAPVQFNRTTSDGDIALFYKDGITVGSIGVASSVPIFNTSTSTGALGVEGTRIYQWDSGQFYPLLDNSKNIGAASYRFDDIYATNGTIQTSDRNEKQDIEALSDAEQRVAVACKGLLRKFRWKDAVEEKGDDARIHFGIIAQDLQDAFAAEGLDAGRYAMFISSTWWETQTEVPAVEAVAAVEATYDEDGNELTAAVEAVEAKDAYTRTATYETLEEAPEGATERTRLGVRYPELLAFIIATI